MNVRSAWSWARATIVLTAQEKQAVVCVAAALLIGIVTQQYRAAHPRIRAAAPAAKTHKQPMTRVKPPPAEPPADNEDGDD